VYQEAETMKTKASENKSIMSSYKNQYIDKLRFE